ncbi:hypothetical protein [Marinigracilibium pacificum]|uniref:Uncharacterized protein n=1 Tax=Marinigracilibium pacificum TaxID=2729599 RepID=A0A848IT44_9BACT|nr:hypothetical protein [Marinigracilibium pacificum]NMM47507.1 hypothetical protein [Marinigracilibium pacificum]
MSCNQKDKNDQVNLISNQNIRSQLERYMTGKKDHYVSNEDVFLKYLINNDTIELVDKLNEEINRRGSSIKRTDELEGILAEGEVKNANSKINNIYKLSVSYSIGWSVLQVVVKENIVDSSYNLNACHFRFDNPEDYVLDLDTVFFRKEKKITKEEWQKFNDLLNYSNFWDIALFKERRFLDGVTVTLEGKIRTKFGRELYQNLEIRSPDKGAFSDACEYLILLTGEDDDYLRIVD